MVSDAQRRAYWIGGLGMAAVGVGLLFWAKEANASTGSTGSGGSGASGTGLLNPTSSNPSTGPNGCTWRNGVDPLPNDVYTLAGQIANGAGPVPWTDGQTYGPVTMSDGKSYRFVMARGSTSSTNPVGDIIAQVCS